MTLTGTINLNHSRNEFRCSIFNGVPRTARVVGHLKPNEVDACCSHPGKLGFLIEYRLVTRTKRQ